MEKAASPTVLNPAIAYLDLSIVKRINQTSGDLRTWTGKHRRESSEASNANWKKICGSAKDAENASVKSKHAYVKHMAHT